MNPEEEAAVEKIQSKKFSVLSQEEIALWLKKYNEIWMSIIKRQRNEEDPNDCGYRSGDYGLREKV